MRSRWAGWRRGLEARARERAVRFRRLDKDLRAMVETREIPRPARQPVPEDGSLPPDVAALVDDGQVHRGVSLLVNLTGLDGSEAERMVAAHRARCPGQDRRGQESRG